MDKAEQRALEAYPIIKGTFIPANNEHEEITQDCNKFVREAYIKGYHQNQEDFKLTAQDIDIILNIIFDYNAQIRENMFIPGKRIPNNEEYCSAIAERFNNCKSELNKFND